MRIAFLDTETFGLDADRHVIFEIGLVLRDYKQDGDGYIVAGPDERREVYLVPTFKEMQRAEPTALRLNRYYQRDFRGHLQIDPEDRQAFFHDLAGELSNAYLCGACIDFDALRLERMMRKAGAIGAWRYHLIDIETMIAGHFKLLPPWKSKALYEKLGLELNEDHVHTAMADCLDVVRAFEKLMSLG